MLFRSNTQHWLRRPTLNQFVLQVTLVIIALFNWPVLSLLMHSEDLTFGNASVAFCALFAVVFLVTGVFLHLLFLLSVRLGRIVSVLLILTSAAALYFMVTYQVILDRTMIGNILNTDTNEAGQYFSLTFILYLVGLGLLPSWWVLKTPIARSSRWKLLLQGGLSIVACLAVIWSASSSWLWIDKHAKVLGGTVLPWSYVANSLRYYQDYAKKNAEVVLLPDGAISNQTKSVVVLVIGESARAENFALYGYTRDTNPNLMADEDVVALPNAQSCASYTTAAVACILAHVPESQMDENYEPLPSYLQRQGVEVIWRTKNWGEPKIAVSSYLTSGELEAQCSGEECANDGVLLAGLKEQIESSTHDKILVVLHQSGSHGPTYYKKYPKAFEHFSPVCDSVELASCTHDALMNAYDNTIRYNDHFLHTLKTMLLTLQEAETSFLYLSDHGESLGENGLYLHGTPYSLAPKQQLTIPFLVWASPLFVSQHQLDLQSLRQREQSGQELVFHSVLGALGVASPVYNAEHDLFEQARVK